MNKLKAVLTLLLSEAPLPERLRDHPIGGEWNAFRDLHIEPDWLLLYRVANGELQLARTGSHSDRFRE